MNKKEEVVAFNDGLGVRLCEATVDVIECVRLESRKARELQKPSEDFMIARFICSHKC